MIGSISTFRIPSTFRVKQGFLGGLPGVPKVFCSEGSLFRRFIVPRVRCSEGSFVRIVYVSFMRVCCRLLLSDRHKANICVKPSVHRQVNRVGPAHVSFYRACIDTYRTSSDC